MDFLYQPQNTPACESTETCKTQINKLLVALSELIQTVTFPCSESNCSELPFRIFNLINSDIKLKKKNQFELNEQVFYIIITWK